MSDERELMVEQKRRLGELIQHPGWPILVTIANERRMMLGQAATAPLESLNDLPKQEFAKGQLRGIADVFSMPVDYIALVTLQIKMLDQKIEETTNAPSGRTEHGDTEPDSSDSGRSDLSP